MNDDLRRSIFVLAGMPASGMAELLEQRDRQGLFGRYSEEAAALNCSGGKQYHFFKNFKAKAENHPNFSWPEQAMLHVEITAACSFKRNSYHLFRDESFILNEFRNNLSGILSHYSNKVINTIEPDLALLARRYFARPHVSSNVARLYKERDEETLRCMFNAWNRYLAEVDCYQLRTEWDNQIQNYRIVEPSHQRRAHVDLRTWATATFSLQWRTHVEPSPRLGGQIGNE